MSPAFLVFNITMGDNIEIIKILEIFVESPLLSPANKTIIQVKSYRWYNRFTLQRIEMNRLESIIYRSKTCLFFNICHNIIDLSCISTKKVIIELPLSTQCLTLYRRRLVQYQYWVRLPFIQNKYQIRLRL